MMQFYDEEFSSPFSRPPMAGLVVTRSNSNVDFRAVGLAEFGRAGGYFKRQIKSLSKVSRAQLAVDRASDPRL